MKIVNQVTDYKSVYLHFFLNFWTNTVINFPKNTKLMSFSIVQCRFSIFVIENLKFKRQCSQYLYLNPTCVFSDLSELSVLPAGFTSDSLVHNVKI